MKLTAGAGAWDGLGRCACSSLPSLPERRREERRVLGPVVRPAHNCGYQWDGGGDRSDGDQLQMLDGVRVRDLSPARRCDLVQLRALLQAGRRGRSQSVPRQSRASGSALSRAGPWPSLSTIRGSPAFGDRTSWSALGAVSLSGTFLPKRLPPLPISGKQRSL